MECQHFDYPGTDGSMQQTSTGRPGTVWLALATSPFEIAIALYFALFGFGSLIFNDLTPPTVMEASTAALIIVWHVSLALGGACALIGRLLELERLETSGLAFIIFACGFYSIALAWGIGIGSVGAVGAFACIAAGSGFRMYVIWKSLRGQEIAHRVLKELQNKPDSGGTDE